MKIKKYIICTIVLFVIFILNLVMVVNEEKTNLNTKINLKKFMAQYDYEALEDLVEDKHLVLETNKKFTRTSKYEKKLISFAKEVTEKFFDKSFFLEDMLKIYFYREPLKLLGTTETYYTPEYMNYIQDMNSFIELKTKITNDNISYDSITDIKLYYTYPDYYVIQVYLDDVNTMGDVVIQYRIIKEKSSGMYKVQSVLYFKESSLSEIYSNDSNVKRFVLEEKSGIEKISDEKALEVFDKYSESLVKINVYKDNEIIDRATGFFIGPDIIVTTFDIFSNNILGKYDYEILTYNGDECTYKGIISFSGFYNMAVIKISEQVGKGIEMVYPMTGNRGDYVMVPSITGNMYIGTINEVIDSDYYVINSNLLLNDVDKGSPILNSNGEFIGVNSRINSGSNLLISIHYFVLSNIYTNTRPHAVETIDTIRFEYNLSEIR